MKKSLFLLLALMMLALCFTACSHTHEFDEWITTKQATCTENGEMVRYCSCGEKQTEIIVAGGAHIEVVDNAVSPTCTAEGLTEGKHCSVCNEIILAQKVVTKLEHTLDADGVCALCDQPIIPTEGIAYEKSEDGTYAIVTGYEGTATKIRIADTYEGLPVTHIRDSAINYKETIISVIIPDSVTTIGACAFGGCTGITSVAIPASVTDIGYAPFIACNNLVSIEVDEDNPNYKSINGHLCTKDGKTLIEYAGGTPDTNAVIPDGVTTIGYGAFAYCTNIYTISIPDSVTTIGEWAFAGCSGLTSVVIPDSVTTIGDYAFAGCSGLTSVVIPDSVTTIGEYAFALCDILTSVVIGDSVTTIGDSAFSSCSSLTSVVIGGSVTTIGDCAFADCERLTSIEVSENNTNYKSIDGNLYSKDGKTLIQYAIGKNDTSFVIPNNVTTIGNYAFYGCNSLTSVVIGDSVTTIGDYAFYNCDNLTSVVIGDSITTIGDSTFSYCSGLTSVVIPDSVTSIGEYAFYRCDSLSSLVIPDSVTTIGEGAFSSCFKLKDVYYTGSEEEWKAITIGSDNSSLTNATKHYNYVPEE